jgi:hypothetical protein
MPSEEFKTVQRSWDDGSIYTITVYTRPKTKAVLVRFNYVWWPEGDRDRTAQVSEIVMPIPKGEAEWLAYRLIKHLLRGDHVFEKLGDIWDDVKDRLASPDPEPPPPPPPDPDEGDEVEEAVSRLHRVLFQPYSVPVEERFGELWTLCGLEPLGIPDIRGGVVDGGTLATEPPQWAPTTPLESAVHALYYSGLFQPRNKAVIGFFDAVWAAADLEEKGIVDIVNGRLH